MDKTGKTIKVVSLFSGCGGGDLGLTGGFSFLGKRYGKLDFDIIWANDFDSYAVATYKKNLGRHIIESDIKKTDLNSIPDHDLLVGGFPCQSFSIVGQRKGLSDPRGLLYLKMVKILKLKQPAVFIAENVKGLISVKRGEVFKKIIGDFESAGYKVSWEILNASQFGIPQKRERVFMVGVKNTKNLSFCFPDGLNKITPLSAVIDSHKNIDKKYYFSNKALLGLKKANKAFTKGRAQDVTKPCNTISTHLAKVSLNGTDPVILVEKNKYRRFTPREAARIQSFPDDFAFEGSDGKQYIQIGNAIPPVLMWYIAKAIQNQIFNGRHIQQTETERDNVSHQSKEYFNREVSFPLFAKK